MEVVKIVISYIRFTDYTPQLIIIEKSVIIHIYLQAHMQKIFFSNLNNNAPIIYRQVL